MSTTAVEERIVVERGSGNVFADLGFADAEAELLRAKLVLALGHEVKRRGLRQKDAAALLGIGQPDVSRLLRGQTGHFSVDKILELLARLRFDVQVTLIPSEAERGRVRVLVAG